MLIDETSSALDPEMVKEMLDTLVPVAQDDLSMVCVTHGMGFARPQADRVVFTDKGRTLEIATPAEFFASPGHELAKAFLRDILCP